MTIRRMPPPARPLESIDYDEVNHTELVQIARFNEVPNISKALSREAVLATIVGQLQAVELEDPLDQYRRRLWKWWDRFWTKFRMQIPAIKKPKDALRLSDMEVAYWWVKNRDQLT